MGSDPIPVTWQATVLPLTLYLHILLKMERYIRFKLTPIDWKSIMLSLH